METLIVIGAVALFLAMLLNATAPAPQPPRIIYLQPMSEPDLAAGQGCLGMIFAVVIFAMLLILLAQSGS
jgi:hypothetical protein